jgi:hypothetical protein
MLFPFTSFRHLDAIRTSGIAKQAPRRVAMSEPERIDRRRAALIAYDVCRRALVSNCVYTRY